MVKVKSIEPLEQMDIALKRFSVEGKEILQQAKIEIQRTLGHFERCKEYWNKEVRRTEVQLQQAKVALANCFRLPDDDCVTAQRRVKYAKDQLKRAQEELKTVKVWKGRIEKATQNYERQAQRLNPEQAKTVAKNLRVVPLIDYGASVSGSGIVSTIHQATESNIAPKQKGNEFEQLVYNKILNRESRETVKRELSVRIVDNQHLDKFGDGVGLTKDRRIDMYIGSDGSIWELKSGYEQGNIDFDQAHEYALMCDAEYIKIRDKERGSEIIRKNISSVNYLFETVEGAKANASHLYAKGINGVWYLDASGNIQLLTS